MKATFEIDFQDKAELSLQLRKLAGTNASYGCTNRLMLIKDIRDLVRGALNAHREPTLTELRDLVNKHVFDV